MAAAAHNSAHHRRAVSAVESYASYSDDSDPEPDYPARRASIRTLPDDDDDPHRLRPPPDLSALPALTARFDAQLDTKFGFAEFADTSDSGSDSGYASSLGASAASSSASKKRATSADPNSTSASDASTSGAHSVSPCLRARYDDVDDDDDDDDDDDCEAFNLDAGTSCIPSPLPPIHNYNDLRSPQGSSASAKSRAKQSSSSSSSAPSKPASSAVMSTLKKRWRGVKRAGVKGTSSASKSLSSLSSTYFASRDAESWEDRHSRLGDEWVNAIIPNWRKKRKTQRVRSLVFRGIPASVRGRVWMCAIGNPLKVSEQLFEVLKERAYVGRMEYLRGREALALADGDVGGNGGRAEPLMENERSAHKAISLDLPRTFPELSFFHAEGSHYEFALRDVLEAFLYLKPDIGYSQGMSFVAATLLLYMDPYDAFSCFVNMLLYKSCFLHFFKMKMPEVRIYLAVHDKLLAEEMPALHAHFKEHSIDSDLYMINWVMSLFCRALPLDLVTRIWDLYVSDGDTAIFRSALGILRLFSSRLLKMKFEELAYFLSHVPGDEIQADELLQSIRSIRLVTRKKFRMLFKECAAEHGKSCEQSSDGSAKGSKPSKS